MSSGLAAGTRAVSHRLDGSLDIFLLLDFYILVLDCSGVAEVPYQQESDNSEYTDSEHGHEIDLLMVAFRAPAHAAGWGACLPSFLTVLAMKGDVIARTNAL